MSFMAEIQAGPGLDLFLELGGTRPGRALEVPRTPYAEVVLASLGGARPRYAAGT